MSVSDAVPSVTVIVGTAIAEATGIPVDQLDDAMIVYRTVDGTVGALSLACCSQHTIQMLAAAIQMLALTPVPDFFHPEPG